MDGEATLEGLELRGANALVCYTPSGSPDILEIRIVR